MPDRSNFVRLFAAFSVVVVCLLWSPGPASASSTAQPDRGVSEELVLEIVTAPDPERLMADLTAEEQVARRPLIEDNLVPL